MRLVERHQGHARGAAPFRVTLVLFFALALSGCAASGSGSSVEIGAVPSQSLSELELIKLKAEIQGIQETTDRNAGWQNDLLAWAPFVTVLVAAGGLFLTLRTQRSDRRTEQRRRHDEELARAVSNLGSGTREMRVNAAAALRAFLGPDSPDLHVDLLQVIIANLKIESDPVIAGVLVNDLEAALRAIVDRKVKLVKLDLSRALLLTRLSVRKLELRGVPVDIAFAGLKQSDFDGFIAPRGVRGYGANLTRASFIKANLHEARFNGVNAVGADFRKARLVAATFKGANLQEAHFAGAKLQSAHFERSTLLRADFAGSDVADAWFCDSKRGQAAMMDDGALRSLSKAKNLDKAHLTRHQKIGASAHRGDAPAMPMYAALLVRHNQLALAKYWYDFAISANVPVESTALRKLSARLAEAGDSSAAHWSELADKYARGSRTTSAEPIGEAKDE
ncbi:pentapeptide repeat-containing protein [Cryobacterium psychrophilum]|uniref:Pentapeptide repeat-containing protein n=1 Tax=Cryobacterium psychrophilum TaxID=41988 RepID=A0A4Y8KVH2_9MICO|nr:pentapeptide repeat-containing protein [Cryobacterium psychrophilum]TDW28793.1 uncharacterized protein YjbI with pentapeptide repeats [Cryobacterium psychrophilum]TFD82437.1 pentapeptide repeat-containing protein [Cryobacterium psychrophilum]